jgi:TPR repeat protein
MIAVRCPCCLHRWETPEGAARLVCPYCGADDVVPTPAAAVETGFSLPLPSGTSVGEGCAPASAGEPQPLLAPPQAPGEIGRLGRYRVFRQLGQGGMGVVFEAEDSRLKRRVALKVMRVEAAACAEGRARFLREAEAAAALDHEHIVPVHDLGEENGAPFLVLPLLKGESLEARLKRQRPLPLAEALRVGREMAEGLAAAHEAGLVHRDVKPANVWLAAPNARVRLLDFGLARLMEGDGGMTRSGAVLGTPAYMSPEQAAGGKDVDARADLFSLGAVLYEMLTGKRAFPGASWMEVMANRLKGRPPAPREANAGVPQEVSALVMRLLAEAPGQRPESARQVARQLRALAAPPAESLHLSASRRAPGRPSGRRWLLAATAVVLLVPLGLFLWPRPASPPDEAPPDQAPPRVEGPQTRPEVTAASAAFALEWHDAARAGLAEGRARSAVRAQALAGAEALHAAVGAELLRLRQTRLEEAERRLGQRAAAGAGQAFAAAGHEAAALPELVRRQRLRRLYRDGLRLISGGEDRDPKAGAALLREAADEGHAPAQYQMGRLYSQGRNAVMIDIVESLRWFRRAAGQGYAPAEVILAVSVAQGWYGLAKDPDEGARRARAALPGLRALAEQGDPLAQGRLGQMYDFGVGVEKDAAEAVRWYRKAAEQGDAGSQIDLGFAYQDGKGVTRDAAEAVRLYRRAAAQGHASGQDQLGWAYQHGIGVPKDEAVAVQWFRRAAEQGHDNGQNNLGYCYNNGRGVAKDEAQAARWYRKAAEQGQPDSMLNLGAMYHDGRGVTRDPDEAVRLYRKAIAHPDASADTRRIARENLDKLGR